MAGVRRTWDKSYYEAKAKERLEMGDDDEKDEKSRTKKAAEKIKEEFMPAPRNAAVRLKATLCPQHVFCA